MRNLSVAKIKKLLREADADEVALLAKTLEADPRQGVRAALKAANNRIKAKSAEAERLEQMHVFEAALKNKDTDVVVGLDEVGRGPLAGPLAVGAVVLPAEARIAGLNDSKKLSAHARERIADEIKRLARAWAVVYVAPERIDEEGMTACLRFAFKTALAQVEEVLDLVDLVLIDGNPLGIDAREKNVIKGDAHCPSIAAASVIAKVERDALMDELDVRYPVYGFKTNKGYGTKDHIAALRTHGLSPVHRRSFCTGIFQETLFS